MRGLEDQVQEPAVGAAPAFRPAVAGPRAAINVRYRDYALPDGVTHSERSPAKVTQLSAMNLRTRSRLNSMRRFGRTTPGIWPLEAMS